MNTSLATFMKLALVATVIVALLWHRLFPLMEDIADKVALYMQHS